METRAHFILIGSFVLVTMFAGFVFVLWLASVEIDTEFKPFDIIFTSAVTGLTEGGDVRYSGIRVGEVKKLSLDPDNPSLVIARVEVDSKVPVTVDSKASLEFQGLTGVGYIQLSGGGPDSETLKAPPGKPVPLIYAEKSALQELLANAPGLLEGANQVVAQLNDILGPENREDIAAILKNLRTFSDTLANRSKEFDAILVNTAKISSDLQTTVVKLEKLSITAEQLLDGEGRTLIEESTETVSSLNALIDANAVAINSFSQDGLGEFSNLMIELVALSQTLERVLARMESDPADYLTGNYGVEYNPQ